MLKIKLLKLLELQHVSVFHKTILREPLVPVKVTYCPSLFSRICWQYAGSMLAACPILFVLGLDTGILPAYCQHTLENNDGQ